MKIVTETIVTTTTTTVTEEKYKVVAPETMQETFMSDSEDEGGKWNWFILCMNILILHEHSDFYLYCVLFDRILAVIPPLFFKVLDAWKFLILEKLWLWKILHSFIYF